MKKRVLSTIMSLAMLVSAAPMAIAENSTTPEIIDLLKDGTSLRSGVNVTAGAKDEHNGNEVTPTFVFSDGANSLLKTATDGNTGTWTHFHGYDCWYQVDLGTVRSITNITYDAFSSAGAYMKDNYVIKLSNDPNFYDDGLVENDVVTVFTQPYLTDDTEPSHVEVDLSNTPKQYRYVRIQKLNDGHTGISLADISVKGYNEYYEQDLTRMSGVEATSNAKGYEDTDPDNMYNYVKSPSNVIDGKYEVQTKENGYTRVDDKYTAFIADFGEADPYVQVDLTAVREISRVKVLPYRGSEAEPTQNEYLRKNIMVWASNNENFEDAKVLYNGAEKTETRDQWIDIDLSNTADYYRYIRVGLSDKTAKLGVTEIIALGYDVFDVEVPETNIPVGKTDVTNIGEVSIPTVKSAIALDWSTVNSNTVYALKQTKDSDGAVTETKTEINPVKVDEYTIGIDLATLTSYTEYKIVVEEVRTANGMEVKPYTSGTFKTAIIAPVAHEKGEMITNIALGAKAEARNYSDATNYTVVDMPHITNGDLSESTGNMITYYAKSIKVYSDEKPSYGYIDLGSAKNIKGLAVKGSDWWYHYAPIIFYGTNTDPTTLANPIKDSSVVRIAEITRSQGEASSIPRSAVNASENYRYIVMSVPESGEKSPSEVMVYGTCKSEDLVQNVNIPADTKGLTNVSNAKVYQQWHTAANSGNKWSWNEVHYINNGEPITVKFKEDTDMSTVTNKTVKLTMVDKTNDEPVVVQTINYTPITDDVNKTLKIDLSELDDFVGMGAVYQATYGNDMREYQLEVTSGVKSVDGTKIAEEKQITNFTTGMIAKAPYVEGKVIKNVAKGKTANTKTILANAKDFVADASGNGLAGTYYPYFTNNYLYAGDNINWNPCSRICKDNGVLIDLGNVYDIIGMGSVTYSAPYHMGGLDVWVSNENTFEKNTTSDFKTINKGKMHNTDALNVQDARYILIENNTGDDNRYVSEFMFYAYVNANEPDIYFTSPKSYKDDAKNETVTTLTAKAENATGKTLILAEYDENGALVKTTSKNAAEKIEVIPVEGHTYKAFVWDSLTGLTPATKAVQY